LKRTFIDLAMLVATALCMVSCGASAPANNQTVTSGLKFRAFVSNPLHPAAGGGGTPVINIVDAAKDAISRALIPLATAGLQDAGPMALSPNKLFTLIYSPANNTMAVITNQQESIAGGPTGTTLPAITLPAATESFFIWIDNATAFVAMPTAPVTGMQPGLVDRLSLGTASISARIPIAGARYLAESHNGNRILALSDNTGVVTIISPSLIGDPTGNPLTPMCCFDHPAGAVFSADDNTAYIFECGAECGGVRAAVTPLDLTTNTIGTPIPVDGATTGFISGNLLYVAGTPPTQPGTNTCTGTMTAAMTCGRLDVVDLTQMTVTSSTIITDGYHTNMQLGADNQLFIGANKCTEIMSLSGGTGEVRGCLSIYDTVKANVVIPAENGDVTGIAPITGRSIVYVCQNGELRIFDTTTDQFKIFPAGTTPPDVVGRAVDVKLVDNGPPPGN